MEALRLQAPVTTRLNALVLPERFAWRHYSFKPLSYYEPQTHNILYKYKHTHFWCLAVYHEAKRARASGTLRKEALRLQAFILFYAHIHNILNIKFLFGAWLVTTRLDALVLPERFAWRHYAFRHRLPRG